MKQMRMILLLNFLTVVPLLQSGEAHEASETSGNVGEGKAVLEVNETEGIRLSPESIRYLQIKTMPAPLNAAYPPGALVHYQENVGVYRYRQGWFKLIVLPSSDFKAEDEIVISGAALLRVFETQAFSGGEGEEE